MTNTNDDLVRAFHEKYGFDIGVPLGSKDGGDGRLYDNGQRLVVGARHMMSADDSIEYERSSLLVEEVGEALIAMATPDRVGLADALADLMYVVIGTAITFDIPLQEVFEEVHRSNMTKQKGYGRLNRAKGKEYQPPRIKEILDAHS